MSYLDLKIKPNLDLEIKNYIQNKNCFFIGLDEVGRGSLAGPIVVCACWIKPMDFENLPHNIRDSKKLSPKSRLQIYEKTKNMCLSSCAACSPFEIDKFGLTIANNLAIHRSLHCLLNKINYRLKKKKTFCIYIDGNVSPDFSKISLVKNSLPDLPSNQINTVVKGDNKIISVSLASIIAKVTRDNLMQNYCKRYPVYNFKKNVGYGSKFHLEMIEKHGICNIHRRSFKPISTTYS